MTSLKFKLLHEVNDGLFSLLTGEAFLSFFNLSERNRRNHNGIRTRGKFFRHSFWDLRSWNLRNQPIKLMRGIFADSLTVNGLRE